MMVLAFKLHDWESVPLEVFLKDKDEYLCGLAPLGAALYYDLISGAVISRDLRAIYRPFALNPKGPHLPSDAPVVHAVEEGTFSYVIITSKGKVRFVGERIRDVNLEDFALFGQEKQYSLLPEGFDIVKGRQLGNFLGLFLERDNRTFMRNAFEACPKCSKEDRIATPGLLDHPKVAYCLRCGIVYQRKQPVKRPRELSLSKLLFKEVSYDLRPN